MSEKLQHDEELLVEVGLKLRAAREAAGLSIDEISATTRINRGFLAQMEAGDLKGLPDPAFVRGFLRNIMQAIELTDPELVDDFSRATGLNTKAGAASLDPPSPAKFEMEVEHLPWGRIAVIALLVVLVAWVGYLLYRVSTEPSAPRPSAQETEPARSPPGNPGKPGTPATPPPSGSLPAQEPAAAPAVESRAGLRLTVRGLEDTWIRLTIDKRPPVDIQVGPAESLQWDAEDEFRLTIGKSNGVAVRLNGDDVLLPAERGRLIPNLVLNKLTLLKIDN
jgi:cytoskeleton protein RodZ